LGNLQNICTDSNPLQSNVGLFLGMDVATTLHSKQNNINFYKIALFAMLLIK
jgi:hypothetical protein